MFLADRQPERQKIDEREYKLFSEEDLDSRIYALDRKTRTQTENTRTKGKALFRILKRSKIYKYFGQTYMQTGRRQTNRIYVENI